ncbi:MAG: hypothetical protein Q8P67_22170, partial [archaeon]|nr:hypothetical protein [archaeon]
MNVTGALEGVGVSCIGNYSIRKQPHGPQLFHGTLYVEMAGSSVDVGMWVGRQGDEKLPLEALATCSADLVVTNLTFTTALFETFAHLI